MKTKNHEYEEGRGKKRGSLVHLLCNTRLPLELMITEANKQKRQSLKDPAFILLRSNIDSLLKKPPSPISVHATYS
jgi:hypothetical protein